MRWKANASHSHSPRGIFSSVSTFSLARSLAHDADHNFILGRRGDANTSKIQHMRKAKRARVSQAIFLHCAARRKSRGWVERKEEHKSSLQFTIRSSEREGELWLGKSHSAPFNNACAPAQLLAPTPAPTNKSCVYLRRQFICTREPPFRPHGKTSFPLSPLDRRGRHKRARSCPE